MTSLSFELIDLPVLSLIVAPMQSLEGHSNPFAGPRMTTHGTTGHGTARHDTARHGMTGKGKERGTSSDDDSQIMMTKNKNKSHNSTKLIPYKIQIVIGRCIENINLIERLPFVGKQSVKQLSLS